MPMKKKKILLPGNFHYSPTEILAIAEECISEFENPQEAAEAFYSRIVGTFVTGDSFNRAEITDTTIGQMDIFGIATDSTYCKKQNDDGTYSLVLPSEFDDSEDYIHNILGTAEYGMESGELELVTNASGSLLLDQTYQPVYKQSFRTTILNTKLQQLANLFHQGRAELGTSAKAAVFAGLFHRIFTQMQGAPHMTSKTEVGQLLSNLETQFVNSNISLETATIDGEYNYHAEIFEAAITPGKQEIAGDLIFVEDESDDILTNDTRLHRIYPNFSLELIRRNDPMVEDHWSSVETQINTLRRRYYNRNSHEQMSNAQYFNNVWVPAFAGATNAQMSLPADTDNLNDLYGNPIRDSERFNLQRRMKRLVFSEHHMGILQDSENMVENYPFFVDIKFDTDKTTRLSDLFSEMGYLDALVSYVAKHEGDTGGKQRIVEGIEVWDLEVTNDEVNKTGERENVVVASRVVFEIERFLKHMSEQLDAGDTIDDGIADNEILSTETTDMANNACDKLKNRIYSLVLKGKLNNYMKDNISTDIKDILTDSTMQTSDTVMYRVDKRIGTDPSASIVQRFYFPNTSKIDLLRYIDTQVRPDQMYTYTIYAYQIVPSVSYKYTDVEISIDADTATATFERRNQILNGALTEGFDYSASVSDGSVTYTDEYSEMTYSELYDSFLGHSGTLFGEDLNVNATVYSSPSLRLVATPIYAQSVKILSSPPLPPTPTIVPYKNATDCFHLVLQNCVGKMEADPIVIHNEDFALFDSQKAAQRWYPGQKLEFENDDRPGCFEVYRTKAHPTEWSDFKNNLLYKMDTSILTDEEKLTGKLYTSDRYAYAAASKEEIDANVKYYYMFRTVDVHGYVSNPSEIYCVELVNNDGSTYLLVDVVDFAPKVPKIGTKKFGRYLKIAPRITQVMIDNQRYNSGTEAKNNQMELGIDDYTVWGKKFKFVIKSLKTGREVHLKANFAKTHNRTEREASDD